MNRQQIECYIKENMNGGIDTFRSNCPVCGNRNTFSASYVNGEVLYHCFHVSCKLNGKFDKELSIQEIKDALPSRMLSNGISYSDTTTCFSIPSYWLNPLQNERCLNFLKYWQILEMYRDGQVNIFYDPRLRRCVFLLKDHNKEIKGATGRNLYNEPPRWHIYSRINACPGLVSTKKNTSTIILVEDFVSACNASRIFHAAALLGTILGDGTIPYLLPYSKVLVALDPDASNKSIRIQKQLSPYIETLVVPIKKDIKYYNQQELKELENEYR